jgi:hypothetical protein
MKKGVNPMAAPLAIEQMILNHNIGVNISDAATFKGHQLSEFSMVGHTHTAGQITSGIFDPARLPTATASSKGIVQLSSSTSSNDNLSAATPAAVYAVKQEADGKADIGHKHVPGDITTAGAFTVRLNAKNEQADGVGIIRNIIISSSAPGAPVAGKDGQIYLQYEA